MKMRHLPKIAAFGIASLALIGASQPATAKNSNSDQLKAAIIFNIIRFVDFGPGQMNRTIQFCTDRRAGASRELASLGGRKIGARELVYRTVESGSTKGCDVVYLGSASAADIDRVKDRGVLVIGDESNFIGAGGTIGLVQMGKQIRFEVNTRAARAAQLGISSKLLRLAARVQQ
jgi:hypothetical protein